MNESPNPKRTRRYVLIMSGATDVLLGAAILLVGLGIFPIDITDYGFPLWVILLVGGLIFISGVWMVAYNYSRLDE